MVKSRCLCRPTSALLYITRLRTATLLSQYPAYIQAVSAAISGCTQISRRAVHTSCVFYAEIRRLLVSRERTRPDRFQGKHITIRRTFTGGYGEGFQLGYSRLATGSAYDLHGLVTGLHQFRYLSILRTGCGLASRAVLYTSSASVARGITSTPYLFSDPKIPIHGYGFGEVCRTQPARSQFFVSFSSFRTTLAQMAKMHALEGLPPAGSPFHCRPRVLKPVLPSFASINTGPPNQFSIYQTRVRQLLLGDKPHFHQSGRYWQGRYITSRTVNACDVSVSFARAISVCCKISHHYFGDPFAHRFAFCTTSSEITAVAPFTPTTQTLAFRFATCSSRSCRGCPPTSRGSTFRFEPSRR